MCHPCIIDSGRHRYWLKNETSLIHSPFEREFVCDQFAIIFVTYEMSGCHCEEWSEEAISKARGLLRCTRPDNLSPPVTERFLTSKFRLPMATYAGLFHKVEEFRLFAFDHTVAVFLTGERSVADIFAVIAHCFGNDVSNVGVFLYEFRCECLELTDHI